MIKTVVKLQVLQVTECSRPLQLVEHILSKHGEMCLSDSVLNMDIGAVPHLLCTHKAGAQS